MATALWQIQRDPRWLNIVIEELSLITIDPIRRQTAAEALHEFDDPIAVLALVKALDDPNGLVRYHAARGLLALHELQNSSEDPEHLTSRVLSESAERRNGAREEILAGIAGRPISLQSHLTIEASRAD